MQAESTGCIFNAASSAKLSVRTAWLRSALKPYFLRKIGIILDKSFLQAANDARILELSRDYELVMPASLLYELFKSERHKRARQLGKFPNTRKPFYLAPRLGEMFDFEIEKKLPYSKPTNRRTEKDFTKHEKFRDIGYELNAEERDAILFFEKNIEKDAEKLLSALEGLENSSLDELSELRKDDCRMKKYLVLNESLIQVRAAEIIYASEIEAGESTNSSVKTTCEWAIFRYVQAMHLATIDLFCRYESVSAIRASSKATEKIYHDIIDVHYLVTGLLEGNLATRDKRMIGWWRLLKGSEGLTTD